MRRQGWRAAGGKAQTRSAERAHALPHPLRSAPLGAQKRSAAYMDARRYPLYTCIDSATSAQVLSSISVMSAASPWGCGAQGRGASARGCGC